MRCIPATTENAAMVALCSMNFPAGMPSLAVSLLAYVHLHTCSKADALLCTSTHVCDLSFKHQ